MPDHQTNTLCLECRGHRNSVQGNREYMFKYTYGIEWKEYETMLLAQDKKCKICGTTKSGCHWGEDRFFVDHSHKTGKVRGLLCGNCNQGIGKLQDNPELLRKAADYIEHS